MVALGNRKISGSKLKTRITFLLLLLVMLSFPAISQAACSVYKGFATINEVHRNGNSTRFLEVKMLSASITDAVYDSWTISSCTLDGCTGDISLSAGNDSGLPYIVLEKALITSQNYINIEAGNNDGSDIILKDGSGNTIDYVSINNITGQQDASCTPAFDWTFPGVGSNAHTINRVEDGTGDWTGTGAGASGGETASDTNDIEPAPDGAVLPVLSTVATSLGSSVTFEVSLSDAPKSYDVSFDYSTVDDTALAGVDFIAINGTATIPAGESQITITVLGTGSCVGGGSFYLFIDNPVSATIASNYTAGVISAVMDHFVVEHNKSGINCVAENITVKAVCGSGGVYAGYTGSIVLDTQSGNGDWSLNSGTAINFSDATASDGLATYTFDAADNGIATFFLDYQSGTASIDVDVYDGIFRDDDSEGNLLFTPNGFTVTTAPLTDPFAGVLDTTIDTQIAATSFNLYLTAYGQTASDPACGVIEEYTGSKSLNFWSDYNNPNTGTLRVSVNSVNAATSEATSAAQTIVFSSGRSAALPVNYPDAGKIVLNMKDIVTVNADLPTGIRGVSDAFVVQPAGFVLSDIKRSSDNFPNPGTATDENGAAFIAAGADFSVTVTAVNALNVATPNYGQESIPESVLLMTTLVAPLTGENPSIAFNNGFDGFLNGVDSGTDFHWDEVGIITLTPRVSDGDYLDSGDVTGTISANVGRFYPDHFITAIGPGSFANTCITGTAFTYVGESFTYLSNPTVTAMAQSVLNTPTANYTGAWGRLGAAGVSLTYPAADNTQLDDEGTLIAVTSSAGTMGRMDNGDGSLTFSIGSISADSFAYVRNDGQVAPFTSDLTISLTAVSDGEASASDLLVAKAINPAGNLQRFGRAYAQDVHGTMSQVGDSLTMPIGSLFFDSSGNWVLNTDDSCSIYNYTKTDISVTATATPTTPVTLVGGMGNLSLTLSGAGNPGGSSVVNTVWPSWLQYDYDSIDQLLDSNFYDDNPSATATFGIFRGDDRYLYWREAP